MATNIVLNPPPMRFGLDIVLSEDTYPFVDPDALKMRFGLTMRHESISGAIVELLPQPMRFGLTIGQGSPVVGSLPMRFGLTMQVGQVLYPKLTTKSPIAYVLEIHALGDEPSDMPGFGVITDAINPKWNASLGGIDTLTFTYKADDAKTANLDITHEVWIRRYDSGEIKQRFLLWKKRTYRTHTEVRIDYTYTSLMSQLQKVDIDATCLSGTRLDDILGRVLAE
ncbi:MAG: hypothetical protein GY833_01335, partial [Aestuariibacter sp.]|nr:hypothetical protein [Aestuariibacter sp.]